MCRAAATRVEQSTFFNPTNLSVRLGRTTITKLSLCPVLRSLGIQGRDQLLGCWGHSNCSGQNDVPRRNLPAVDRKSTRLNSSHITNSYAVFCLKKKNEIVGIGDAHKQAEQMWRNIGLAVQAAGGTVTDVIKITFFLKDIRYVWAFFFNDTATTEIYTLSLHDALPI